jgi:hypothetical protein
MILQIRNLNLLYIILSLVFFCVYKFLKFSVVFNIKSTITYNYTISYKFYFYSILLLLLLILH